MLETGTSGLMSGEGKPPVAIRSRSRALPRLYPGQRESKERKKMLKQALIGPDGKLRVIWRAALYYALGTWVVFPLLHWPFALTAKFLHLTPGLTAGNITLAGLRNLIVALICTGAF